MASQNPNEDRFQVVSNGTVARVYDSQTDKFVRGPQGRVDLTPLEAHDLRQEHLDD